MSINLITKFVPYCDEQFAVESKKSLLTNQDFEFTGAKSIKIFSVGNNDMCDYDRLGTGSGATGSRYGAVGSLSTTIQEMILSKDRASSWVIDRLDQEETQQVVQAASSLARQIREVIIPEVDTYTYGKMIAGAGHKPAALALTAANIYEEIIKATTALDNAGVPETGRVLVVNPDIYVLMKKSTDIIMNTEISNEERIKGVIGMVDGMAVLKIPTVRLPAKAGFLIAHPVATCAPTKLEAFTIHDNPPGISGSLVELRIVYDAYVLDSKKSAIYYQAIL